MKIMLIRHAEKPAKDIKGVKENGKDSKRFLSPRGWQRAGALAVLFSQSSRGLVVPKYIYATEPKDDSHRPLMTVKPLADKIGIKANNKFDVDDYESMIKHAMKRNGDVLIAWHHGRIPKIANFILENKESPQVWPNNRFDLVWVFHTGKLIQVPQLLLSGDIDEPIRSTN
jgi:phosphohistidine phosphatase SixA